jgi:peptidoglycan/LPS O-acetylase OafA/YrhL
MALPICIIVTNFFEKYFEETKGIRFVAKYFGKYSLELYLIHYIIFVWDSQFGLKSLYFNFARIPEYLIYILVSLFLSILLNKIVNRSLFLITKNKNYLN